MKVEEIKDGESAKIKLPAIGTRKAVRCHFSGPVKNPVDENPDNTLIILRYWITKKQRWDFKIYLYWELALWNDWPCKYIGNE